MPTPPATFNAPVSVLVEAALPSTLTSPPTCNVDVGFVLIPIPTLPPFARGFRNKGVNELFPAQLINPAPETISTPIPIEYNVPVVDLVDVISNGKLASVSFPAVWSGIELFPTDELPDKIIFPPQRVPLFTPE